MPHSMIIRVERNGKFIDRVHHHQSACIAELLRILIDFLYNYKRFKKIVQQGYMIMICFGSPPPPLHSPEENRFLNNCACYGITGKKAEVWLAKNKGMTNKEIANHLFKSPATVSEHITDVKRKLKVNTDEEVLELFRGRTQKCVSVQLSLFPDMD